MTFFPTKVYTLIVTCFKIKIKVIDKKIGCRRRENLISLN